MKKPTAFVTRKKFLAAFALLCPLLVAAQSSTPSAQPAAAKPPAATGTAKQWAIEATDARLIDSFTRWAKQAGIQLRWDAGRHIEVGAVDIYSGTVEQAMVAALSSPSVSNSDYPLEICFYPNRPQLARVTRRGEQWRDCPMTQALDSSISN